MKTLLACWCILWCTAWMAAAADAPVTEGKKPVELKGKRAVLIIASQNFRDEEFSESAKEFAQALVGALEETVAPKAAAPAPAAPLKGGK